MKKQKVSQAIILLEVCCTLLLKTYQPVSGAVFFIFIARFLPSLSDLGFVTGIQTIIAFFAILSTLGLARSATRFVSSYIGAGEKEKAADFYVLLFIIWLIPSTIFCMWWLHI
jgi:O-antigen/teichoic acid export membrane protein